MSGAAKNTASPHYMAKVAVVGSSSVGKTALVQRFICPGVEPAPAKSVFNAKSVTIDGSSIQLQIWTVVSALPNRCVQQQTSCVPTYYRGADAVIIVYDVTSICSFDNAKVLSFFVHARRPMMFPMMLPPVCRVATMMNRLLLFLKKT